jgi:hypothetical protein
MMERMAIAPNIYSLNYAFEKVSTVFCMNNPDDIDALGHVIHSPQNP